MRTYQDCRTLGGPARIWVGPAATLLGSDCNSYFPYAIPGTLTSTNTNIALTSATDNTTIDKANGIMNVAYIRDTSEVVLAYDKTVTTTLDDVDVVRGVSKLRSELTTNETTFAQATLAGDELRFVGEYKDFTVNDPDNWNSFDTLDTVDVMTNTEYDEFGTNQQGTKDVFNGEKKVTFKMSLPLTLSPKYMRAVMAGDPIVVHDDNATPDDRLYQALFVNLSGKRTQAKSVVIIPEAIALDPDFKDLDGNIKLALSWWFWRATPKVTNTYSYNKGSQVKVDIEWTCLFDPIFQGYGLLAPISHIGSHYPTLI